MSAPVRAGLPGKPLPSALAEPPSLDWSEPATLAATARSPGSASLALDSDGDGVAGWTAACSGLAAVWPGDQVIEAAAFDSNGALGSAQQVSGTDKFNEDAMLVVNGGRAILVWSNAPAPGQESLRYSTTTLG